MARFAEHLGSEAPKSIPDGNGTGKTILPRKGHEKGTAEPRLHILGDLSLGQDIDPGPSRSAQGLVSEPMGAFPRDPPQNAG